MTSQLQRFQAVVRIAAAAVLAVAWVGASIATAQTSPQPKSGSPPSAKPDGRVTPPVPDADPKGLKPPPGETQKPAVKKPQLGRVIPDAPGERAKLLDDLYAHLATAPDEESSKPFVEAIERIWLSPGSDTVSVLMERALQSTGQQRNDLALELLTAVVELAPDYAEGWNRRAYIFYTEGDYERALGDLRRVLALDPNHYKALDGVGQIMRQLDRKPQALKAYEQLLAVNPSWPHIQATVDELRRDVEGRGL